MTFSITSIWTIFTPIPLSWSQGTAISLKSKLTDYSLNLDRLERFKPTESVIDRLNNFEDNSKRKRVKVVRIPRMIKRDIRRSYCSMYCNVSNSYDEALIVSFFQTFACENMQLIHRSPTSILSNLHLRGRDLALRYKLAYMNLSPDKILRLTDIRIHQRADSERSRCEVWANFSFEHTLIYKTDPQRLVDAILQNNQNAHLPGGGILDTSLPVPKKTKRKLLELSELSKVVSKFRVEDHFCRLKEPLHIKVVGSTVFKLDEEKRIEQLISYPMSMEVITETGSAPVPAIDNWDCIYSCMFNSKY